jgi:hypothetical protein
MEWLKITFFADLYVINMQHIEEKSCKNKGNQLFSLNFYIKAVNIFNIFNINN